MRCVTQSREDILGPSFAGAILTVFLNILSVACERYKFTSVE